MKHPHSALDVQLLRVLVTLVAERSVSRTAARLNQTQPAVSTALRKLRELCNDALLVRERSGMVPTERALQLREHALAALAQIDAMRAGPARFEPAHSTQTFHVASPDYLAMGFLGGVVERVRREAPRARLEVHPLAADYDYEQALADGHLDIVIGNWPQPPQRLHLSLLLEDELVCLASRHNPLVERGLTLDSYLAAAHVVPAPYSRQQRGVVETFLAARRLSRDARVVVPYFEVAPYLLVDSDLLFTTARHFALHFARSLPLAVLPLPIEFPRMRFYQLWHERSQQQPSHRWLRSLLTDAASRLAAPADGNAAG
ncbi:MAG TPA: LysR family transcriptional regulator [Rubrivivax sp.]|mgnify:CR=1 FL=1|nr:LysR family transcriptional regulator [Rubrivivax sp.]HPO17597.1 LysR family transcriptional regulator [Rubrivivax sp.]